MRPVVSNRSKKSINSRASEKRKALKRQRRRRKIVLRRGMRNR
jgi:hypothetical protein